MTVRPRGDLPATRRGSVLSRWVVQRSSSSSPMMMPSGPRTRLRAGALLAGERNEALVVFGAGRAVAQVLVDGGEQLAHVPALELALHVLRKQRQDSLATGVLARSAEQPRKRIAFAHHASSRSRCPSRSRRSRSFRRASWSPL